MANATFRIPGRFYPPASRLGRWLEGRLGDPLAAEAIYLLLAGAGAVVLILLYFLTGMQYGAPSEIGLSTATLWIVHVGLAAGYLAGVVYGRQSAIHLQLDENELRIRRPDRGDHVSIPAGAVREVERVDARTYHRHYRKYERTRTFVNRPTEPVLLLHTETGPVALGLDPADQKSLCTALREHRTQSPAGELAC